MNTAPPRNLPEPQDATHRNHDREAASGEVATESEGGTGLRLAVAAILLLGIFGGLFAYGVLSRHHETAKLNADTQQTLDAPPAVDVVQVHRGDASQILSLPGNARAFYETTIYARTSGYLKEWKHDIGDHVKKGELLATIETPELDDQLAAAEARVIEQNSEVSLSQSVVNFAKLSYDRWQSAVPEGVVSTQDRDQKEAELETAKAKLESSQAQLKLVGTDVQRLQTLVGFKQVVAPFDGVITRRAVDIGDLVTAGSTTSTTPLFTIANSDQIRVFVDVPQSAIEQIKVGMNVQVIVPDLSNKAFEGEVDRTADSIDPESRTLRTEILVPNSNYELKPGMYVQATLLTNRAAPPLEIPAAALVSKPSGPEAAVVDSDGTVHFKTIHIERDLGDRIEIDAGLSDGDNVALNISSDVSDGQKIDSHKVDTSS